MKQPLADVKQFPMTPEDAKEIWREMERKERAYEEYRVGFVVAEEHIEIAIREQHPNCDYVYPLWQPTREEFLKWAEQA